MRRPPWRWLQPQRRAADRPLTGLDCRALNDPRSIIGRLVDCPANAADDHIGRCATRGSGLGLRSSTKYIVLYASRRPDLPQNEKLLEFCWQKCVFGD